MPRRAPGLSPLSPPAASHAVPVSWRWGGGVVPEAAGWRGGDAASTSHATALGFTPFFPSSSPPTTLSAGGTAWAARLAAAPLATSTWVRGAVGHAQRGFWWASPPPPPSFCVFLPGVTVFCVCCPPLLHALARRPCHLSRAGLYTGCASGGGEEAGPGGRQRGGGGDAMPAQTHTCTVFFFPPDRGPSPPPPFPHTGTHMQTGEEVGIKLVSWREREEKGGRVFDNNTDCGLTISPLSHTPTGVEVVAPPPAHV